MAEARSLIWLCAVLLVACAFCPALVYAAPVMLVGWGVRLWWFRRHKKGAAKKPRPVNFADIVRKTNQMLAESREARLIAKIVSGGQTGVDRGALRAAKKRGFPYGGIVPLGRRAEDGVVPPEFDQMTEDDSEHYLPRTEKNVVNADFTLILTTNPGPLNGGTLQTEEFCKQHQKPYLVTTVKTDPRELRTEIRRRVHKDGIVLNVAGPRESKEPGIEALTEQLVAKLLALDSDPSESCK